MGNYRDLNVWKSGKVLAVDVYRITSHGKWRYDRGLTDQVRRAAISVPSNIAEGDARKSDRDSSRFFSIAQGSLAELSTQLEIAVEIGYVECDQMNELFERIDTLQSSLGALIKSRKSMA